MKNTSLFEQIANMHPGDSINVYFPNNFTIDYTKTVLTDGKWRETIVKSSCTRMNVYYWDEDDHRCKDYYFYNGDDDNWICKGRSVTNESWGKIKAYLHTIE